MIDVRVHDLNLLQCIYAKYTTARELKTFHFGLYSVERPGNITRITEKLNCLTI